MARLRLSRSEKTAGTVMAQTSSAQREPSMEEILASIRRIIEDSDSARQPLEEADAPQFSMPVEAGEIQQEVEAFRAGLDEVGKFDEAVGLDEVDAPQPNASSQKMLVQPVEATSDQPWEALEQTAPPQAATLQPANGVAAHSERETEPVEPPDGVEAIVGQFASAPVQAPASAPASATSAAETKPSLISDHAGRQVAAAFGELSEAFAASRRRSFDEMAEEMLRPMLQDWLDNNLPTLVERLVREEIERVARGS